MAKAKPPSGEGKKHGDKGGGDYEVGYGRPPAAGRIRPGERRNPKGRPKGSRSLKAALTKTLSRRVKLTTNGKTEWVTYFDALVMTLTTIGLKGQLGAYRILLEMIKAAGMITPSENEDDSGGKLNEADAALLAGVIAKLDRQED